MKRIVFILALLVTPTSFAANQTWDGGAGADNRWSNPTNWVSNVAPIAGDNVNFPSGTYTTRADTGNVGTYYLYSNANVITRSSQALTVSYLYMGFNDSQINMSNVFYGGFYSPTTSRVGDFAGNGNFYLEFADSSNTIGGTFALGNDRPAGRKGNTIIKVNSGAELYLPSGLGYYQASSPSYLTNIFIVNGYAKVKQSSGTYQIFGYSDNDMHRMTWSVGGGNLEFDGNLGVGGHMYLFGYAGNYNVAVTNGTFIMGNTLTNISGNLGFGYSDNSYAGKSIITLNTTNSTVMLAATNIFFTQFATGANAGYMLGRQVINRGSIYLGNSKNTGKIQFGSGGAANNNCTNIFTASNCSVSMKTDTVDIGNRSSSGINYPSSIVALTNITGGITCNILSVGRGTGATAYTNMYARLIFDSGTISCSNLYWGSSLAGSETDAIIEQRGGIMRVHTLVGSPSVRGTYIFNSGDMYLKGTWTAIEIEPWFSATGVGTLIKSTNDLVGYTHIYYSQATSGGSGNRKIPTTAQKIPQY